MTGGRRLTHPEWWLRRSAARLGVPLESLRRVVQVFRSLEGRRKHQIRCFTCGYKVHDTDHTDDPTRAYFEIPYEDEAEIVCANCVTPEMMVYHLNRAGR